MPAPAALRDVRADAGNGHVEDGERAHPVGHGARVRKRDRSAPVVADEMKALPAIARGRDNSHRIVHQPVDMIIGGVARVRPRARRVTALIGRHRAIARGRKCRHLRAPAMHGFRKAVQQQHQPRAGLAGDQRVKGETG